MNRPKLINNTQWKHRGTGKATAQDDHSLKSATNCFLCNSLKVQLTCTLSIS